MKEFVEKLIEKLKKYQEELDTDIWARECDNWYGQYCNGESEGIDVAISIINKLAEEYSAITPQNLEDGWIPCSERLPEEATTAYLVTEEFIVNSKKYYIVDIRLFGTEDEWLQSRRKVIAWQPLPRPYKEGSVNNA